VEARNIGYKFTVLIEFLCVEEGNHTPVGVPSQGNLDANRICCFLLSFNMVMTHCLLDKTTQVSIIHRLGRLVHLRLKLRWKPV